MRRLYMLLSGALVSLSLIAALQLRGPHDERTELILHDQYGRVTSGTKLGVTVGEPWANADRAVRGLFTPGYILCVTGTREQLSHGGGAFCDTPPRKGIAQVSYRDRSWRNGVITLTLKDGHVAEITWHYPGPFYIDL